MLLLNEGIHLTDVFYRSLRDHIVHGTGQFIRGATRLEIQDYQICLENSLENLLMVPFRYSNLPAIIAETLWVYSGRTDMSFLTYYLKAAKKYSDDGDTWRAGYGKRLMEQFAIMDDGKHDMVSQVDRLIKYMRRDLATTRAVLVIPDGSDYQLDEYGEEKKDEPCTMFVQFMHRGPNLNCFVRMRSNDIMLGCFNVNFFEWTMLQQLIANELNCSPGSYHVNAVSMHIYDNWVKKLPLILENQLPIDIYSIVEPYRLTTKWSTLKKYLPEFMMFEQDLRKTPLTNASLSSLDGKFTEDMRNMMYVMLVTMLHKQGKHTMLLDVLSRITSDIWLIGCLEYMVRRLGNSFFSMIHKIIRETLAKRYCDDGLENITLYIFHSEYEKYCQDKLDGIRKR